MRHGNINLRIMANFIVGVLVSIFIYNVNCNADVKVFTIATENTHGLQSFLRSARVYNIDVEVLGKGLKWTGGDMNKPGGGQKVNILKDKLNQITPTADKDQIILFTDSYDVLFLGTLDNILEKFKSFNNTRVLFSAEQFCWPDASLSTKYPETLSPNPFLNSGGFIGYLPEILEIVNYKPIKDDEDDQLYYTNVYLDKSSREGLNITLDHNSVIFQNLNGALSDVELTKNGTEWPYIENTVTKNQPLILHGNGPSKLMMNSYYRNYLAKAWSPIHGCKICEEKRTELDENNLPNVLLAVFVEQPTPFIEDFLRQLLNIDYPKDKLHLLLRNNVEYHEDEINAFFEANSTKFASAKRIKPSDSITEAEARNIAKERCMGTVCDYLFAIDSVVRIHKGVLRYLITTGFDVIAPMLTRPGKEWSNFWGALNRDGYYARSTDYMDIVYGTISGIWNVPYITNCYLVKISLLRDMKENSITYSMENVDPDMAFCKSLRDEGVFMHVSNEYDFGHLVNPETFDIKRTNPDIYEVIENKVDWEARYLHPEYKLSLEKDNHSMPCPDVYWFPLMTPRFCKEWIEIMENFGQWSDGSNNDKRLESGYEAVPTRDIHMNQVGLERQWLHILREYVRPLQEKVFIGYYHNPPKSLMNFVVRYRPDEQPSLRPHHDSSTYTINLALNTPGVDFVGGGCRFIRYNCSVRNTKPGWLLMHPGRLTHYHEGLLVTNGTRYIMISFVDP